MVLWELVFVVVISVLGDGEGEGSGGKCLGAVGHELGSLSEV